MGERGCPLENGTKMSVCSQIAGIKRLGRQLGSQKIHGCIGPVFTVNDYSIDLIQIGMYLREVYDHFFVAC